MTAADIQGTLEYLVPGFVALKVFYVVGLRTRRSDFGWTVLSIATAAGLNVLATRAGITDATERVIVATVFGVVVALIAGAAWVRIDRRVPRVKAAFDRQAWDATWSHEGWYQVWIRGGPIVLGAPLTVSESADTDDLDVYLGDPKWVDRGDGHRVPMTGVTGVWVAARDIELVQVLDPSYRAPAEAAQGQGEALGAEVHID